MSTGAKQHMTPVFHLNQFVGAQPTGCLWVYNGKEDRCWPSVPERVAHENYAYSTKRSDGTWDTRLDDWITNIEGPGVKTYEKLLRREIPEDRSDDKGAFAVYLAVLHCRTMAMRRHTAEVYAGIVALHNQLTGNHPGALERALDIVERKEGAPLSPEDREAFKEALLDPSDFTFTVPKTETFVAFTGVPGVANILAAMHWSICIPLKGFFFTSDNPITNYADPESPQHLGFKNKTAEIYFPLSPRLLLMMTWRDDVPKLGGLPEHVVGQMNARTAYYAHQFIYSHLEHKHVMKLAKKAASLAHLKTINSDRVPQFGGIKIKR